MTWELIDEEQMRRAHIEDAYGWMEQAYKALEFAGEVHRARAVKGLMHGLLGESGQQNDGSYQRAYWAGKNARAFDKEWG